MEEPEPGLLKFNLTDAGIDFRLEPGNCKARSR